MSAIVGLIYAAICKASECRVLSFFLCRAGLVVLPLGTRQHEADRGAGFSLAEINLGVTELGCTRR